MKTTIIWHSSNTFGRLHTSLFFSDMVYSIENGQRKQFAHFLHNILLASELLSPSSHYYHQCYFTILWHWKLTKLAFNRDELIISYFNLHNENWKSVYQHENTAFYGPIDKSRDSGCSAIIDPVRVIERIGHFLYNTYSCLPSW